MAPIIVRLALNRAGGAAPAFTSPQAPAGVVSLGYWVCENHPVSSMGWSPHLRRRRRPCPVCDSPSRGDAPRMPEGFRIELDKDGWRH
jgi:hypothetical protein